MEYRRLGNRGLKLSALSFGFWVTFKDQVDTKLAERCIGTGYDAGVNYFDNSEAYANGESERIMGQALKNPHVSSVILGASRLDQIKENLGVMGLLPEMTPEMVMRVEAAIAE